MDDPEATAKHYRDGYFYPGDMAVEREDERVRILGRVDDVLNFAGQKVAIQPFEDRARKILGVENLCVFSLQDEDGKDILLVVIECAQLPDRARLQAMAKQARPVSQVRFALINALPRGENGMMKVNRRKLLEIVRETDNRTASSRGANPGDTAARP